MSNADHFLDVATRPLAANPELQVHARRDLQDKMLSSADDGFWSEAAEKLEKHDRSWLGKRWGSIAVIAVVLLTVLYAVLQLLGSLRIQAVFSGLGVNIPSWAKEPDVRSHRRLVQHLSPEQRLILLGDTSKATNAEQLEELHLRYPDNPRYYIDYVIACRDQTNRLPTDFLETAARIDPDNAWFPLFAAANLADSVEALPRTAQEKKDRLPKKWKILDESRYQESLDLIEKSSRLPRFDSYQQERIREQIALLPPPTDFLNSISRLTFVAGRSSSTLAWRKVPDLIAARAEFLANQGDREAFQVLLTNWERLLVRQLKDESSLVDLLAVQGLIIGPLLNLKDAATRLGLEPDAARLQQIQNNIDLDREERKARKAETSIADAVNQHGSLMSKLTLPHLTEMGLATPDLSLDRLTPVRRTEHAVLGKIFTMTFEWSLAFFSVVCVIYRFRHGALARTVSSRITGLLTRGDWAWILILAPLLPSLFYQAIYHLTTLGGRDWNLAYSKFIIPAIQLNTWAFLTILTPLVVVRWRLKIRTQGLDLNLPRPIVGWSLLGIGVCALPLAGLGYLTKSPFSGVFVGYACLAILQIWWIALILRALFGKKSRAVGRQAVARILVPAYLICFCVMAVIAPLYHAQERQWVARDNLMAITPEKPAMSAYEYEVAQIRKAEVLEMLAPLRDIR